MTKAGIAHGLTRNIAARLARVAIAGAGALLDADAREPEDLRRYVASPAGTTEAALHILMRENRLENLMLRAIAAPTHRSKELAKI